MHHLIQEVIFSGVKADSILIGSAILQHIRERGQELDPRLEYELHLKGSTVDIIFTDLDGSALYPEITEGSVDGEFFPSAHEGYCGTVLLYKSECVQEVLAHEMFHVFQHLAHKADQKLKSWEEDLWKRSKFPLGSYALKGGPMEGAAEVWRAHLGHYEDSEEDSLWVLEDEWADYFDAVISHCW